MKNIPELLAPAGSPEALKAAIDAGADAVYLSGKKFGARQYATNFGMAQIQEAVNYAHLRGVKIYVTVNTLIKESEVSSLGQYLLRLYELGVDAILVQDVGVASLAQYLVPELNIHASTQMTIHHGDGLKWAERLGFKRAVLSRELSLNEIKKMDQESGLELEIFLHGALCYCYSGQCLLSSFIGGRSGNRGMCAQPCRKPYHMVVGRTDSYGRPQNLKPIPLEDQYLLSPQDLSLYKKLDVVTDSGIKSLKIEGRMRPPEYVATVVKIYRNALDQIALGNWEPSLKELETLQMTFNREFSEGHLFKAKGKELMGRDKPGHRGLYLGKVTKYLPKNKTAEIEINTITRPEVGDGLYLKPSPKYTGQGLDLEKTPIFRKNKMIIPLKKPAPAGIEVYLTRRKKLIDDTKAIIKASNINGSDKNLIKVDLSFKIDENKYPTLEGRWKPLGNGKSEMVVRVIDPNPMETALTRPLTSEQIQKQLTKTGDKPFKVKFIDFRYPGGLFSPLKDLNKLRRNLMDKIELITLESYLPSIESLKKSKNLLNELKELNEIREINEIKINESDLNKDLNCQISPDQVDISVYVDNMENLEAALKCGAKRIYFEPFLFTNQEILEKCYYSSSKNKLKRNKTKNSISKSEYDEKIVNLVVKSQKLCEEHDVQFVWKWPNITRPSLLKHLKEIHGMVYEKLSFYPDIMVGSHGIAPYINQSHPSISVYGASSLNIWNHHTIEELSVNYHLLTLSPELSKKDLEKMCDKTFSTKNVPPKTIPAIKLEILVQGNLESVISNDCLITPDLIPENLVSLLKNNSFWGLQDAKKRIFPLKISSECETILLNSVEICLIDYLDEILSMGIFNLAIDARGRTPDYITDMVNYYLKGVKFTLESSKLTQSNKNIIKINKIKNMVKKISLGGITSSNFLKGVGKANDKK